MVGDVRFVQLNPETQSFGQLLPLLHVLPNRLLAFVDERFDAKIFDLFLAVNAQLFADFDLDGKTVCVPSCFPFTEITSHGFVARE